ncbi:hypothetical protein A3A93_02695 [Candidatus Roizmanbacteria bacterium RIFCSPLOWO2_01_FULL_38_12]|uniref:Uncharacterized protein n=1 Tax=Candidatus Roizmanbacteria bacterium RIFCSPLOWO2_01_FULL_38_12 TaxID=1802061 RepID=A0A1F7IUG9_9BACT|nr:MAG: hypothetical protein A2861_02685 [Candidatus Roizmanbacteria bacterium RIFCSPHIGHO2_01_FULL_38_15]OGK34350.1 MAG: hypothetical protein A3F59_04910 [Candidatus Roizmanbacteria bacterium RIFCSPHIGHO2_12_FULL_38_13]OGK47007.1 MAG: hypothetical protein A3A93_02695 [Candidatus Roizmanbacteria bacterium RIFCSPLOWO2_01_FULL_38_12]
MSDTEPIVGNAITADRLSQIPDYRNQWYSRTEHLPKSEDILPPDDIDNSIDQTIQIGDYLRNNLRQNEAFMEVINTQGIRSMRMAKQQNMIPDSAQAYVYAMPTVGGPQAMEYRTREVKGTVFYALTGQSSFGAAKYELI